MLARLLDEEGTRWALIGGYAIAAHGFVRLSEDVDILVDPSKENASRWIKALARLPDGAARELLTKEGMRDKDRADAAVLRRALEILREKGRR